ncbi:MAG TPA: hypothetical protein VFV47_02000 [Hyphomicrobiaceae bacterium]|nr:hypothetical protein [Hyphomicrobiaceae bacterium]
MASSEHLLPEAQAALREGRAIPMIVDYRPAEIPDHTLTVFGLIDSRTFSGSFLPDHFFGGESIRVEIAHPAVPPTPPLTTDSADAEAIHDLWFRWNNAVRDDFFALVRAVALSLTLERLNQAIQDALPVDVPADQQASKRKGKVKRSPRKRSAAKKQPSTRKARTRRRP